MVSRPGRPETLLDYFVNTPKNSQTFKALHIERALSTLALCTMHEPYMVSARDSGAKTRDPHVSPVERPHKNKTRWAPAGNRAQTLQSDSYTMSVTRVNVFRKMASG